MIYLLSPLAKEGTKHLPMIAFTLWDVALEVAPYDYLMFTSKQAVVSAERLNPQWKTIPTLAIGKATAKQIEKLGGTVAYLPESFYGASLGKDIIERFSDKKILYIRPKEVSFDSKTFLAKVGMTLDEAIVYETHCMKYNPSDRPKEGAMIIFTSPSTIHCFLKNFAWKMSYTAVVIGEATKEHLPEYTRVFVAEVPLIGSCIRKAKELLKANQL